MRKKIAPTISAMLVIIGLFIVYAGSKQPTAPSTSANQQPGEPQATSTATQATEPVVSNGGVKEPEQTFQRILTQDGFGKYLSHSGSGGVHSNGASWSLDKYSRTYHSEQNRIEHQVASLSDPEIQEKSRQELWASVDMAKCWGEADREFAKQRDNFLAAHRADWLDIWHFDRYDPGTRLAYFSPVDDSILRAPGISVKIGLREMDSLLSQFAQLDKDALESKVNEYLQYQCDEGKNLALLQGVSDPQLLEQRCRLMMMTENAKEKATHDVRSKNLLIVGKGDLLRRKIDKLFIIDRDSETILYTLPREVLAPLGDLHWYEPITLHDYFSARYHDSDPVSDE